MSHFTITVAIPGDVESGSDLYAAVSSALDPFSEHLEVKPYLTFTGEQIAADADFQAVWVKVQAEHPGQVSFSQAARDWFGGIMVAGNLYSTYNPASQWDWWVIGGRWAGEWILKDGATRALESESSAFGFTDASQDPRRTDAARKREIEAESLTPSFAYVGLDGEWNQMGRVHWFGIVTDESSEEAWAADYVQWLVSLPADTWLVKVDAHM